MSGIQEFNTKWENKINEKLKKYPELIGYANYIKGNHAMTTNYQYVSRVIDFLIFTNKTISDLTFDDYIAYLASIKNKTSSYQRTVFFALKRFSEYLVYSNKNNFNPMQLIEAPKNIESIATKQKREKGFLTKEEVKITLSSIEKGVGSHKAQVRQEDWKERDLAILYIFLATGIRCSALVKLDIDNINWEESTIIVIDKGSKVHKYILPLNVKEILKAWMNKRELFLNGKYVDALFISNQRKRIGTSAVYDIVKKYSCNIKGKNISPHKLRATFGTHLYNETRDIKFVQDQMGHSNPKTTELYIRGNKDADRKKAADIMSNFLNN